MSGTTGRRRHVAKQPEELSPSEIVAADRAKRSKVAAACGVDIAPDVPAGTSVYVSWPEERYSPIQYNSFAVGGCSVDLVTQEGETVRDCYRRGIALLAPLVEEQFPEALEAYKQRHAAAKRGTR